MNGSVSVEREYTVSPIIRRDRPLTPGPYIHHTLFGVLLQDPTQSRTNNPVMPEGWEENPEGAMAGCGMQEAGEATEMIDE